MAQKFSIWIDTDTGTWGDTANLVYVELDYGGMDTLDHMSDSEIIAFAKERA